MAEPRSVVITGASRGLGLASAAYLYAQGWRVVAAMRSVSSGLETLRRETGAAEGDPRLLGVALDLADEESIAAAAAEIERLVGAPYALVHNAGIAGAAAAEETSAELWQRMFRTNLFGPVQLTNRLLPAMRATGRGRIVIVSSQGAIRGMPSISAYSASKGASERWGEALAQEIAPFGLGVTIIVAGTFSTEILTDQSQDHGDAGGPYAVLYERIKEAGKSVVTSARPPLVFARGLAKCLADTRPFVRRAVGTDAVALSISARLMSGSLMHRIVGKAMKLPAAGELRGQAAQRSVRS